MRRHHCRRRRRRRWQFPKCLVRCNTLYVCHNDVGRTEIDTTQIYIFHVRVCILYCV